jgi:Sortilin, neurotensin receptor 3,
MGVGSIGATLDRYEDSATFLSTNAGVDWTMVSPDAHKYEFGDQGSILVLVNDEEAVSDLRYSTNLGKSWWASSIDQIEYSIEFLCTGIHMISESRSGHEL